MNDTTPESRRCEVCGDPIRVGNKYGVCTNGSKPACVEARRRKRPQRAPEPRCEICGKKVNRNNAMGVCGRSNPECMRERARRRREGFAADPERLVVSVGDIFGKWTALESCTAQKQFVLCRCECGTERRVQAEKLITGRSRSCGCGAVAAMVQARFSDPYIPAGAVFGRLTVLQDVARSTDRALCRCVCGREKEVNPLGLKNGYSKSCGCLAQERRSTLGGFSKHPLYQTWNGILDRCNDPRSSSYFNYGGRGITVCQRWLDPWAFAEDIEREIGPRPEGMSESGRVLYSLDRWPDNDGGYWCGRCAECTSKGQAFNVRWSTTPEQVINQRKVFTLTRDVLRLTLERDALAARIAELEAGIAVSAGSIRDRP